ncbi:putative UDP-glucose 4-epimerase [Candidatus Rhodobacter oscarellae]|uniref:Putative UDP-glucose 4-epimerase n=2 Tax=Candidatus Rhodobacter oscarellae TaxID=1675527 RepID=A0A0J9E5X5_9RHOB|nr:putative UDP-glucose 4-epimerase [Candidatus Rhodobacter lobularis]
MLAQAWAGRGDMRWVSRAGPRRWALADGPSGLAPHLEGAGCVLCLAGVTAGSQAALAGNREIALAVLRATDIAAAAPHIFLASSMAVYGRAEGLSVEDGPTAPAGPYGQAKLEMEQASHALAAQAGLGLTQLRLGNVVGADVLGQNLAARRPITLDQFPDGRTPVRSYVDAERLALVLDRLIERAVSGQSLPPVLNLAAAPALEMGALLAAMGQTYQTRAAPEGALAVSEMSVKRLSALVPGAAAPVSAQQAARAWKAFRP